MSSTTLLLMSFSFGTIYCPKFFINSHILKFKFQITQTNSDEEIIKSKVVDPDEFYNFVVDEFFI
jgi:hypothetical protein